MGDNGDSKALVYIAVGALAAVGAGYLVWRYGMSEETKQRTLRAVREATKKTMDTVKSVATMAKESAGDVAVQAMDGATQVRARAVKSAGEMGQRLRP